MIGNKKLRSVTGIIMALLLVVGQFFTSGADVNAASKQKTLNITDISLSVGQSQRLKVSNGKNVKWSSSKKSVVSVSKNGTIKAKKAGTATITAKVSGKKLKCNVVVHKPSAKKKDVLVAYFSQTGTTRAVAKKIQKLTGGDLLQIKPQKKYTSNYDKLVKIAKKEINKNTRPKVTTAAKNIKSYDVIYVGYPIWWHTTPRVVNTFLEKYNLKGKTVIPFCTSGGSEIDESLPALRKSAKGATIKEGYTADTGSTAEIRKWLKDIGEVGNTKPSNTTAPTQNPTISPTLAPTQMPTAEPTLVPTTEPTILPTQEPTTDPTAVPTQTSAPTPDSGSQEKGKLLVAYFSWSGTSERIAQNIIAQTGADSFRIERETPYSTDYNTVAYGEAKTEADTNARPPIKAPLTSVAQYDKIVICYPIWWHTAPMTVGTFLESYDLTGKTIYPISQSASMSRTQYEESVAFIKDCAKGATVDDGLFSKDDTAIRDYINEKVLK